MRLGIAGARLPPCSTRAPGGNGTLDFVDQNKTGPGSCARIAAITRAAAAPFVSASITASPNSDDGGEQSAFAAGVAAAVATQAEQTATEASDRSEAAVVVAQDAGQQAAAASETAWDARIAVDDLRAEMGAAMSALSDQIGALLAGGAPAAGSDPEEAPAPPKNETSAEAGEGEAGEGEGEKPKEEKPKAKSYGSSWWFGK